MSDASRGALTPGPSPAARERGAAGGVRASLVSTPRQADFLALPQTPLCYWLRPRFFELLAGRTLGDVADVCQGLATADDDRFVRFVWEVRPVEWARPLRERRWVPFEKGGGYGKWFGHHWWVVDWEDNGARIKAFPASVVRNEQYYFREGWTYSQVARGALGFRELPLDGMMSSKSSGVFTLEPGAGLAAVLNARPSSFIARVIAARLDIRESYVARIPLTEHIPNVLADYERVCVALKRWLVAQEPTERTFRPSPLAPLPPSGRGDGGEGDEEQVALGAHIPIPTETFLEELSQKLEIHPISVYWLLKELREREGLVSPPLVKQAMEDYVSVTILCLLGYRWPEQDAYEQEHGPILDPALVDEDGIIPLVPCGDQPPALERIRMRLERDFGPEGAEQSEREFRQRVGRDLDDWLRRDFFKRHVQRFKQRPIAWHLVSPERTFEAFVLYHKLSRATLQKLRAQYAGGLIARLRAKQERARGRGAAAEVSRLQLQIEDVEEFRARLEKIERGDELKYRIRCRWKGEADTGRPGPYAPDIDDGVKVNIRPFQEAGLLAVKEVIKKW